MENNSSTERLYLNDQDCNSIFQIPPHLLESYGANLPSKASLRVDDSGKKWRVAIEKFKDSYFFTDGWKEFAEQVDLKSLDWLKFKSCSFSKQTGTSKGITMEKNSDVNGTTSSVRNVGKDDKCPPAETGLSFTREMKMYNRHKLYVPRKFALDIGIHKGEKIKLVDSEGRVWPLQVKEHDGVFTLGVGWRAFVIDHKNNLMVGSKVSFTWLSGKMLQARIVEVGPDNQPLCTARVKQLQDNGESSVATKTLSFCKEMKKYHQHCLEFPQYFARAIGLPKDEGLKLRNGEGREWPVSVIKRIKTGTFCMCRGWTDFVLDNKVMVGSKVSFTWLSGNMLQTEISDVGTDKTPLFGPTHKKKKCL